MGKIEVKVSDPTISVKRPKGKVEGDSQNKYRVTKLCSMLFSNNT